MTRTGLGASKNLVEHGLDLDGQPCKMDSRNLPHEEWLARFDQTDPQTGQRYRVNPDGTRVYLATRPFFGGGAES